MALYTYYDKVENWEEIFLNEDGTKNNLDFSLGLLCIGIGMNEISEKNKVEFLRRTRIWQNAVAPVASIGPRSIYLEKAGVDTLVGFKCNASTLSNVEFRNKIINLLDERIVILNDDPKKVFLVDALKED